MIATQAETGNPTGLISEKAVELVFIALATCLVAGAYVDAWDQLNAGNSRGLLGQFQEAIVDGSWLALTGFLLLVLTVNRRRGLPLARSLPPGYDVALAASLVFAMGVLLDPYWIAVFGRHSDIERMIAPTRLLSIVAGLVLVGVPLRSGLLRRVPVATLPMLVSGALVLSALTFATQFAHPFVNPFAAARSDVRAVSPVWVAEDIGIAALVLQTLVVTAFALIMLRSLQLPFGSLTLVFGLNGLLVAILKTHWEFVAGAAIAGAVADLLVHRLHPSALRPWRFRGFAAGVAITYAGSYLGTLTLVDGTWWRPALLAGSVALIGILAWVMSYAVLPLEPRLAPPPAAGAVVAESDVEAALKNLHDIRALAASPLSGLPCLHGPPEHAGAELAALIKQVISEMAGSHSTRDAECGRILLDYYVRRVGGHELVMGPMHVSKQTYFRRLDKGKALVAERLDELSELALTQGLAR